jgi:LacI family transcriptional regulator
MEKLTVKDIARESGYGTGTVSRVLNGEPHVSKKARDAIMKVIEDNHFQRNENARALRAQAEAGIVTLVKGKNNPLLGAIVEDIHRRLAPLDIASSISYMSEKGDEKSSIANLISAQNPKGLLLVGSNLDFAKDGKAGFKIPAVVITNSAVSLNIPNVSSVCTDDHAASVAMVNYLIEMGHRKIGVIGGDPKGSALSLNRLFGCQMAMMQHGIFFDLQKQYVPSEFSFQGGYDAVIELNKKFPEATAVFALSDEIAIGAMRAVYDSGKSVPADLSIAGFDGIEFSRFTHPVLTTIRQDTAQIAARSLDILMRKIKGESGAVYENVPFIFQKGTSVRKLS